MKYVDVKNEVAFHKIFGNPDKTTALISFLNAVLSLEDDAKVVTVQFEDPYIDPMPNVGILVFIDIIATDQTGRQFIVEIQVADKEGFDKRILHYDSLEEANPINWSQDISLGRPTYFISILEFCIDDDPEYYSYRKDLNIGSGDFSIQYFFIELPKFEKAWPALENTIDHWTYFIKNGKDVDSIPDGLEAGLKIAYQEADKDNWTKTALEAYSDAATKEANQIQERFDAALGGFAEGFAEGYMDAVANKLDEDAIIPNTVIELDGFNIDHATIATTLNISLEQVQAILEAHKAGGDDN